MYDWAPISHQTLLDDDDDIIHSVVSTLGDSMGQISPHLLILLYFFELFYAEAGVSFDGVQTLCFLTTLFNNVINSFTGKILVQLVHHSLKDFQLQKLQDG